MTMPDIRTLITVAAFMYILGAVVVVVVARRRFPVSGTDWWAVGSCSSGLGYVLMALRGVIPLFFSVVLSNILIFGGMVLVWNGMRHFLGKGNFPARMLVPILGLCVCAAAALFTYSVVDFDLRARLLVYGLGFGTIAVGTGATLMRHQGEKPMATFTSWVYLTWGAGGFLSFMGELFVPGQAVVLLDNPPATTLFAVLTVVQKVASTSGMLLMLNESMEHQLGERTRGLRREIRRTEKALAGEREAVASNIRFRDMISHEYRTPLSVLDMELDMLEMAGTGGRGGSSILLGKIRDNVELLEEVINQGRERRPYTGIEPRLRPRAMDLGQALAQVVREVRACPGGERAGLSVRDGAPVIVSADSALLKTALEDLLGSMLHWNSQPASVRVSLESGDGLALITVVADPFARSGEESTGDYCRMVVGLHKGRMDETREGARTTVRILLPLGKESDNEA